MNAPELAWLNGRWLPLADATVSVLDRGFIFGDGIYEVIPCFGGRPFRLAAHLRRMAEGLRALGIAADFVAEAPEVVRRLIEHHGGGDVSVYLQVTRGVAPRDHAFPVPPVPPTTFAMLMPLPAGDPRPACAVTLADIRWLRCDLKTTSLVANCLLRQAALDAGADEGILLRDGRLTEGAVTSVFVVHGGVAWTPPLSRDVLPGVTRDVVVEVLRADGVEVREQDVDERHLRSAEEIWLTSSTRDVVPVVRLDGVDVGRGAPGPLWRRALDLYRLHRARFAAGSADD